MRSPAAATASTCSTGVGVRGKATSQRPAGPAEGGPGGPGLGEWADQALRVSVAGAAGVLEGEGREQPPQAGALLQPDEAVGRQDDEARGGNGGGGRGG